MKIVFMLLRALLAALVVAAGAVTLYRGLTSHVHFYAFGSVFLWFFAIAVALTTGALSSFTIDAFRSARGGSARWGLGALAALSWMTLAGLGWVSLCGWVPTSTPQAEDRWLAQYAADLRSGALDWVRHDAAAVAQIGQPARVSFTERRGQSMMNDMNDMGVDVELRIDGSKGSGVLRVKGGVAGASGGEPFPACRWTFAGRSVAVGKRPCD